jgi:nucleoside-diphosphate-sugar epimerase
MTRVLVTGCAGGVGRAVCAELLHRGHEVVGFDRIASPLEHETIIADICDSDAVNAAADGVDGVVHLAATPDESGFIEDLIEPNVRGLFHICDAARSRNMSKVVLASSIQVVSGHRWDHPIALEEGPCVINHYALTKLWAETMGEMYARCYDLSVIAARLGWLPRSPEHHEELKSSPVGRDVFLSHDDAGRFFTACIEADMSSGQFEILFATSIAKDRMRVDLEPAARVVGYVPRDTWPEGIAFS